MGSSLNGTGITFSDSTSQASARTGPGYQLFTSSGTFTVPAGISTVKVTCIGGGGGGSQQWISNGGAGGVAVGVYSVTPGGTVAVTVGGGGAAVANGTAAAGSTSSFGALCSATGGSAGSSTYPNNASAPPGSGTNGNIQNSNVTRGVGAFPGAGGRQPPNNAANYLPAITFSPTMTIINSINGRECPGAAGINYTACGNAVAGGVGGAVLVEW